MSSAIKIVLTMIALVLIMLGLLCYHIDAMIVFYLALVAVIISLIIFKPFKPS